MEKDVIHDDTWEQSVVNMSLVYEASRVGGLDADDTERLLLAVRTAGDNKGSIMVTITDGGMLELAHNMIRSLDAVPCDAPRLVIGLGRNLCHNFEGDPKSTCVEVFQDATSESEVAWGSHEYWEVVYRKHVVLTIVAMSMATRHVVYSDPDVAYLDCPVSYFAHTYKRSHDIVFSPNNMLDPSATSVEDVAEIYETRGFENILIGPGKRHADINTGLFFMTSSSKVANLMLEAMRIFKEQEFTRGHYQQFSIAKALGAVPGLRVGVADGGRLVNGNVFWGHGHLLKAKDVVSVHANWMEPSLKGPCLEEAGLWVDVGSPARLSIERRLALERQGERQPAAGMDASFATVESCGGLAAAGQKQDAQTRFVEHALRAPAEPGDAGCYVWMPSGCEKRNFHAKMSWRLASGSTYLTQAECTSKAPEEFNRWCGTLDAQALWIAAPPAAPSEPGCYAWLPTGCKENLRNDAAGWIRDIWGEQSSDARADREHCEAFRKGHIDTWCGVTNTKMTFVTEPR